MDLNEMPVSGAFARHPWELVRAGFFAGIVESVVGQGDLTLLDAGSGDAWLAQQFLKRCGKLRITCFDPGYATTPPPPGAPDAVSFASSFPERRFSIVTALDVLEHVENDREFLTQLVSALEPGGFLLASVPSWPRLYSRHDAALLHYRRYRPSSFRAMLESASLEILESGGVFHSLLVVRSLQVLRERRRRISDPDADGRHTLEWRGGKLARRAVQGVLHLETAGSRLSARHGLQIPGLSTWALCQRPA